MKEELVFLKTEENTTVFIIESARIGQISQSGFSSCLNMEF